MSAMSKVLITGSSGTIGSVLHANLENNHSITSFDLPELDARDYELLAKHARGHDAIVHLAWDTVTDNWKSGRMNPDNIAMTDNVYRAAVEAGVKRVVMASSVNADGRFQSPEPG